MDKKYQVFISSTYMDMRDERQAAVEAILDAGHIPAGMELFAASDKAQMDVIKGWIDESDIFMLILGGRYGSIEPESAKSYIQLEYEYAVAKGKPFFALYMTDAAINAKVQKFGIDFIEQNDTKKLNEFRAQVKSKLCSEIEDVKDVHIRIGKSIRALESSRDLAGWVRGSTIPDMSALLDELKELRTENAKLKRSQKTDSPDVLSANLLESDVKIDLEVPLEFHYVFDQWNREEEEYETMRGVWNGTYGQVFQLIAPSLLHEPSDSIAQKTLDDILAEQLERDSVDIKEADFQTFKLKMIKFGVIGLVRKGEYLYWNLTDSGKALLIQSV